LKSRETVKQGQFRVRLRLKRRKENGVLQCWRRERLGGFVKKNQGSLSV